MQERKYVVYFGVIFIEKKNALFQRAEAICKSISANGYTPIMVGMTDATLEKNYHSDTLPNGQRYYEIAYPKNTKQWIKSLVDVKAVLSVFENIHPRQIKNIIVADYRFLPMISIKSYCEKNGIDFTIDVQDWFLPQPIWSLNSFVKSLDNFLRLKLLYPCIDRKICISRGFATMYKKTKHLSLMPGTVDINDDKWKKWEYHPVENKIRLAFAGRPGRHCEKEKLDWVLRAVSEIKSDKEIEIKIAGVTKDEFVDGNPKMKDSIENIRVCFLGSIPHDECIRIITESDFSMIVRPDNKLSNYGFSTKISESFACGVPIIATRTSDISEFVKCGENGYICECDYLSVKSVLEKICKLSTNDIAVMHRRTKECNPLICSKYNCELQKVLL